MNTFEIISQFAILIIMALTNYLISRTDKWNKWGFVVGLTGQPFWFYSTWINNQYGMFVLAIWCTYTWSIGIYNRFYKKEVLCVTD